MESNLAFSETNVLNKAINLAYYDVLGDARMINQEPDRYRAVTVQIIQQTAQQILTPENCSELYYKADRSTAQQVV